MRRWIEAAYLPFDSIRSAAFLVAAVLTHWITWSIVALALWRSSQSSGGGGNAGFLMSLFGYLVFIAFPAGLVKRLTKAPRRAKQTPIPTPDPRPTPARVSVLLPERSEGSPGEAAMWASLDPQFFRFAAPPSPVERTEQEGDRPA